MSAGNKHMRKALGQRIVDETETIQFELDNILSKIQKKDVKSLKKVNYDILKQVREGLQNLSRNCKRLDYLIDKIDQPTISGEIVVDLPDSDKVALLGWHEYKKLEEGKLT
jgi:hypothetical protein